MTLREQRGGMPPGHPRPPDATRRYRHEEEDDDALYDVRVPTSTRRYHPTQAPPRTVMRVQYHRAIPPRATRSQDYLAPTTASTSYTESRPHWLLSVGLMLLVMLVGWVLLSILLHWWQVTQDDWHYGRPRTYQTDARVGHNDSSTPSHFTVWNLHGQIVVIEFPGGDAKHAMTYLGPTLTGPEPDLAPATLQFKDVNGDGKPDMVILVQGTPFVFVNDGSTFRPPTATDTISL